MSSPQNSHNLQNPQNPQNSHNPQNPQIPPLFNALKNLNPFKGALAGAGWMLLACLALSLMACIVRLAKPYLSTNEIVVYRTLPSVVILGTLMHFKGHSLKSKFLGRQWIRGTVGATSMYGNFYSLTTGISLGLAMTLAYTHPLFFALISVVWFREKIAKSVIVCILLGFLGVILVSQSATTSGAGVEVHYLEGIVSGLIAGLFAALAYMNVRTLAAQGEPEWRTVFYFSVFSMSYGLIALLTQAFYYHDWSVFHPIDGIRLLFIAGMGATGLMGQLFITYSFSMGEANVTAIFSYSTLVFSALLGLGLFNETISWIGLIGIALVALSGALTTWLKKPPKTAS
jgi:drug/metabolite transporter (DMT)-like permease